MVSIKDVAKQIDEKMTAEARAKMWHGECEYVKSETVDGKEFTIKDYKIEDNKNNKYQYPFVVKIAGNCDGKDVVVTFHSARIVETFKSLNGESVEGDVVTFTQKHTGGNYPMWVIE